MRRLALAGRITASTLGVAAITAVYSLVLPAKPATVALSYLVSILFIATGLGHRRSDRGLAPGVCLLQLLLPAADRHVDDCRPPGLGRAAGVSRDGDRRQPAVGTGAAAREGRARATSGSRAAVRAQPRPAPLRHRRVRAGRDHPSHRRSVRDGGRGPLRPPRGHPLASRPGGPARDRADARRDRAPRRAGPGRIGRDRHAAAPRGRADWRARASGRSARRYGAAVDRQPRGHRPGARARPRRRGTRRGRAGTAASCERPCWTRWLTSSRRH